MATSGKPVYRIAGLVLLVAGMAGLPACRQEPTANSDTVGPSATQPATGPNLILISIDTLRADRLGCYGYDRPTSPAIDALARRGVRFANVTTESSWTLPAHMTLFTGLHPTAHGVTVPTTRLGPSVRTLAEVLKQHGYRTLSYNGGLFIAGSYGFARGFEIYDDEPKPLRKAIRLASWQMEQMPADQRYFLFLHTYDVHCPYDPSPRYAAMFRTRPPEDFLETAGRCGNPYYNRMTLTAGQVRFLSDQYDAGIRAADDALAGFFRFLDRRGAWSDTIVIFLSDHGEEFHEHGQIGHERTLYIESLLVPLIIVAPELGARIVSDQVGLVDLMPTILELLGIAATPTQGHSLVPLIADVTAWPGVGPVFSELDRHVRLRSVRRGELHYIVNLSSDERFLFNLSDDPLEQDNILERDGEAGAHLAELLTRHFEGLTAPGDTLQQALSPEEIERLRSLGYVD